MTYDLEGAVTDTGSQDEPELVEPRDDEVVEPAGDAG